MKVWRRSRRFLWLLVGLLLTDKCLGCGILRIDVNGIIMKRKKRILRGLIIMTMAGALAAIAGVGTASAAGLLVPDELNFGVLSEVGRSYTRTIKLENSDEEQSVTIDVSARRYEDGSIDAKYTKASDWIAFVGGVTHFEIAPQGSVEVAVRVLVPNDAEAGSQYALVELAQAEGEVTQEVLIRMDIAGDGLRYGGKLAKVKISPVNVNCNAKMAYVRVENGGTGGFEAKYSAKLENALGLREAIIETNDSREVRPGQDAEFALSCGGDYAKLAWGIFRLEQKVSYINDEGKLIEETMSRTVVNVPWWAILIAVLLVIAGVAFVVVRRKQKGNKKSPKTADDKDGESGET